MSSCKGNFHADWGGCGHRVSLDPMPNIDIESVMTSTPIAAAGAHIERCDCQNPMLLGE